MFIIKEYMDARVRDVHRGQRRYELMAGVQALRKTQEAEARRNWRTAAMIGPLRRASERKP